MLKTLGLFLLVSTVSFTFAQDEDGKESKVGKSTVNDATKKGSEVDVNAGMTAKAKPTVENWQVTNNVLNVVKQLLKIKVKVSGKNCFHPGKTKPKRKKILIK